jgi:hypothetical protein
VPSLGAWSAMAGHRWCGEQHRLGTATFVIDCEALPLPNPSNYFGVGKVVQTESRLHTGINCKTGNRWGTGFLLASVHIQYF